MAVKKNILAIIGSASENSANLQLVEFIRDVTKHHLNLSVYNELKVEEQAPKIDVALNSDEIRYTIHCLLKQEDKLKNALTQVRNTITKLDIMLECAIEKENN